ncbi:MAG: hypothetical protein RL173_1941 [Fibrobacterota bacterium]
MPLVRMEFLDGQGDGNRPQNQGGTEEEESTGQAHPHERKRYRTDFVGMDPGQELACVVHHSSLPRLRPRILAFSTKNSRARFTRVATVFAFKCKISPISS